MNNLVILKSAAGGQSSLGATGLSAYQLWLMMPGNAGKTMLEFFEALKGDKGDKGASVFDTWLSLPQNQGKDVGDFMQAMRGDAGYSAFELWKLDTGNTEASFTDFLAALKGEKGETGNSAFDAWRMIAGNENKTLEDFVLAIKGDKGDQGIQGIQGKQGEQGIQGIKGDKGNDGIQGINGKSAFDIWKTIAGNENKTLDDYWLFLSSTGGFSFNIIFNNTSEYLISQPRDWTITNVFFKTSETSLVEYSVGNGVYIAASNGINNISVPANVIISFKITFINNKTQTAINLTGNY